MLTPPYKVRLLYDVEGWAYHRRCCALQKYAPADFAVTIGRGYRAQLPDEPYDLVLQLVPDRGEVRRHFQAHNPAVVIVGGLNVGWGHHETRWRALCNTADYVVINNRDCWERLGRPENATCISSGVDMEVYHITTPQLQRASRVLWIGSEFHRHQTRIKGYDEILLPLAAKLAQRGIECDFRLVDSVGCGPRFRGTLPRMDTGDLVQWYNTGRVYVCASSSEGTPNPALEAAACGCVITGTRVGNLPELIIDGENGRLVDRSVETLEAGVLDCLGRYGAMARKMAYLLPPWHWQERAGQYYELFRRLLGVDTATS